MSRVQVLSEAYVNVRHVEARAELARFVALSRWAPAGDEAAYHEAVAQEAYTREQAARRAAEGYRAELLAELALVPTAPPVKPGGGWRTRLAAWWRARFDIEEVRDE